MEKINIKEMTPAEFDIIRNKLRIKEDRTYYLLKTPNEKTKITSVCVNIWNSDYKSNELLESIDTICIINKNNDYIYAKYSEGKISDFSFRNEEYYYNDTKNIDDMKNYIESRKDEFEIYNIKKLNFETDIILDEFIDETIYQTIYEELINSLVDKYNNSSNEEEYLLYKANYQKIIPNTIGKIKSIEPVYLGKPVDIVKMVDNFYGITRDIPEEMTKDFLFREDFIDSSFVLLNEEFNNYSIGRLVDLFIDDNNYDKSLTVNYDLVLGAYDHRFEDENNFYCYMHIFNPTFKSYDLESLNIKKSFKDKYNDRFKEKYNDFIEDALNGEAFIVFKRNSSITPNNLINRLFDMSLWF